MSLNNFHTGNAGSANTVPTHYPDIKERMHAIGKGLYFPRDGDVAQSVPVAHVHAWNPSLNMGNSPDPLLVERRGNNLSQYYIPFAPYTKKAYGLDAESQLLYRSRQQSIGLPGCQSGYGNECPMRSALSRIMPGPRRSRQNLISLPGASAY